MENTALTLSHTKNRVLYVRSIGSENLWEKVDIHRIPKKKIRKLLFVLKKREMPNLRFVSYVASFALGVASVVLLRYVAKELGVDDKLPNFMA